MFDPKILKIYHVKIHKIINYIEKSKDLFCLFTI